MNGPMSLAMLGVVLSAGWLLYPVFRAIGRRLEESATRPAATESSEAAKRLERMEQAIEAMAVEVERISEGQRYVTKLLSAREPARLSAESR